MADAVRGFLSDVDRRLRPSLDASEIEAILLETEQHLRERIRAMEELGLPPESAIHDALISFGSAEAYANEMADAHEATPRSYDRPVLATAKALGIFSTLGIVSTPMWIPSVSPAMGIAWLLGTMGALVLGIAAGSYRSRRLVPGRLIGVSVATAVFAWVCIATMHIDLSVAGGSGIVPRWNAERLIAMFSELDPAGSMSAWETQNLNVLRRAREMGLAPQFKSAAGAIPMVTLCMAATCLSANLVGTWLGRGRRRRRIRRATHA